MAFTGREIVKDNMGRVIGYITEESNGNRMAKDYYGHYLGTYNKAFNMTKDASGRNVGRGDQVMGLIWANKDRR